MLLYAKMADEKGVGDMKESWMLQYTIDVYHFILSTQLQNFTRYSWNRYMCSDTVQFKMYVLEYNT